MPRRSFYLTALIAALTTLIAALAHSQPLPAPTRPTQSQNLSEPSANAIMPVCYIQLENGQLRDLRRLCGKKSTSLVPRNVQRSVLQPNPDVDDDDSTPTAILKPQLVPTRTLSPNQTIPQPTPSPSPSPIGRPANVQSAPGISSTTAPNSPHPLAIPEDNPSRD